MKQALLCTMILLVLAPAYSQNQPSEICGYQREVQRILARKPNFLAWQEAYYQQARQEFMDLSGAKRKIVADTLFYEVPVVFHVLYNKTAENINVSYINSQLNELNLAFRKLTADTQRIRSFFRPLAVDVRIQFVMATTDPSGNPTTGVTRNYTTVTTFAQNMYGGYTTSMKYSGSGGVNAWNPTRYLNIWICNMEWPGYVGIVYGFATPPTGAPNWTQFANATKDSTDMESGVVLHYKIVGKNNPLAPAKYNEGKSAVHEVGHYFGLRHIWGDGSFSNGCSVDDGIFDTPNARAANASCTGQNSCIDAVNDQPDMTENYMDYALDGCAAMFTREQVHMMRYVLNNFRTGLPYREIRHDTIFESSVTQLELFPNPISGMQDLKLQVSGPADISYKVLVIDMSGKQVITAQARSNELRLLDISGLARSIYYVIILDGNNHAVDRKPLVVY